MKPHDAVFKKVFSSPEVALDYLRAELPPEIWQIFRPETLQLASGTFISPNLQEYFSDVLYTARLAAPPEAGPGKQTPTKNEQRSVTISFLLEHKSAQPFCIHQQIGMYQFSVWHYQHTHRQALTPVIPLVIYHGEAQWREHSFPDCFPSAPPEVLPFIPPINFYLTNLSNLPEKEINQRYHALSLQVLFHLLQVAFQEDKLISRADEILKGLARIGEQNPGSGMAKAMFTYLMQMANAQKVNPNTIAKKISRLPKTSQTMFKSVYDALIEEGEERGLQKGLQKGRKEAKQENQIETAGNCLRKGLSIELTAEITGLTEEQVKEIEQRMRNGK